MIQRSTRYNVILFGGSGAGKSSIVNMLADAPVANTSSGASTCTFKSRGYRVNARGMDVTLWDTPGLDEGSGNRLPTAQAITQLYKLLLSLTGGVSLLVLVVRAPRLKDSTTTNWILFRDIICQGKVPTSLIITGLEEEEDPDRWWRKYKGKFERYKIVPSMVACVTASRGKARGDGHVYDVEYNESRVKIQSLIRSTALANPFVVRHLVWVETVIKSWIESGWCGLGKREKKEKQTKDKNPLSALLQVPGITERFVEELTKMFKEIEGGGA